MEKTENPYTVLGLSEDADEASIKKAYRKLAIKYHPDKQTNDADREAATAEFAKIADAYDLLNDPVRRYDWRQAHQSQSLHVASSPANYTPPAPRRSLSPKRNSADKKPHTAKRTTMIRSTSPMPLTKRASVQPNSVRVSPDNQLARKYAGRTPRASTMSPGIPQGRKSGGRSPVRNSGGRKPLRSSGGRSPMRNSGGRSPAPPPNHKSARNSGGRSPVRNAGKSPMRSSGGNSSARRTSTAVLPLNIKSVRKPAAGTTPQRNNSDGNRGRVPMGRMSVAASGTPNAKRPSAGRKKSRASSVGLKKCSTDLNLSHLGQKPAPERKRKIRRSVSMVR